MNNTFLTTFLPFSVVASLILHNVGRPAPEAGGHSLIRPDDGCVKCVPTSRVSTGGAQDFFKLLPELVAHAAVDSKVKWTGEANEGVYDEIDEVACIIIHH